MSGTNGSLIDQQVGFFAIDTFHPGSQVYLLSPSGDAIGPHFSNEWDRFPAEDPTGGMVVWFEPTYSAIVSGLPASSGVWRFASDATIKWSTQYNAPGAIQALGVDRKGNVLALFDGTKQFERGATIGQWFTANGDLGPSFEAIDPDQVVTFGPAQALPVYELFDRVGNGFFIQASTGDWSEPLDGHGKQSVWVGSIDGLGTSTQPAPDWLKANPNTDMHVIHGGTGYALLPLPASAATCSQSIGVFTASGEACGAPQFQLEARACATGNIRIGYDGTVIQDYPDDLDACVTSASCVCSWQFWSGYFK